MAKVKNALFSLGASGTVGGVLCINQSLTSQTARRSPRTKTKATAPQAAMRLKCSQAATSWRALSLPAKTEWRVVAGLTAQNVFAKYLVEWMAQNSTPSAPPFIPMR